MPGDPGRPAAPGDAQQHDAAQELVDHAARDMARPRGAVHQTITALDAPASQPLAGRLATDAGGVGGFTDSPAVALDA
jgi:hypothetical protein